MRRRTKRAKPKKEREYTDDLDLDLDLVLGDVVNEFTGGVVPVVVIPRTQTQEADNATTPQKSSRSG